MLFRLSYPPFYAYSKPNLQVACACHYCNRQQHNNVILMDNGIPVKRQGHVTVDSGCARAYQPSSKQSNHKPQGSQAEPACPTLQYIMFSSRWRALAFSIDVFRRGVRRAGQGMQPSARAPTGMLPED